MKRITIIPALFMLTMLIMVSCNSNKQADASLSKTEDLYAEIIKSSKPTHGKSHPNVLIIASSPRHDSNSTQLALEFERGAKEVGGEVETILLADKKINYISEAEADNAAEEPQNDDAPAIIDKMMAADIIVLAAPVYFQNVDAKMKALFDRTYANGVFRKMRGKEFFYIAVCANKEGLPSQRAVNGMRGFMMCLPESVERGMVKAAGLGGVKNARETEYAKEAYELGKTII